MTNYRAEHDPAAALWRLYAGDVRLLEYAYGDPDDPCPGFRSVRTPSGVEMTMYRPWDHVWHVGLFFTWKYIDGLNFWEGAYEEKKNRSYSVRFEPLNGGSGRGAGFRQTIEYRCWEGIARIREERTCRIVPAPNGYRIDYDAVHENVAPRALLLDRTPHTEQTPWGGYAGYSFRFARNFLNPAITTPNGTTTAEAMFGERVPWCDYSGKVDGERDRWAGVTLLDAADNPRFPTNVSTYDYKDLQFMNAAFLFDAPYEMAAGERLRLRYSFYVHDGAGTIEAGEREWESFQAALQV